MRHSLSISLPRKDLKQLKIESNKEEISVSQVIRQALKEYFAGRELLNLRQIAIRMAHKKGTYLTEEQIFEQIS